MTTLVRQTAAEDWRAIRDIRLRMLRDTPLAFGETWQSASELSDADWQERARSWAPPQSVSYVAETEDGRWLGVMRAYLDGDVAHLVGVYVDEAARGRGNGVADRLLDEVLDWAREVSDEIRLHVHEDNPRATAFYVRRGFAPTGESEDHEVPPYGKNLEYTHKLSR